LWLSEDIHALKVGARAIAAGAGGGRDPQRGVWVAQAAMAPRSRAAEAIAAASALAGATG
jgi:hypothetical protein